MPRRNRPPHRRPLPPDARDDTGPDFRGLGIPRSVSARDGQWLVRDVPAPRATKDYVCPGCHERVASGTGHLVAWRTDVLLGGGPEDRRHWHHHCWAIRR